MKSSTKKKPYWLEIEKKALKCGFTSMCPVGSKALIIDNDIKKKGYSLCVNFSNPKAIIISLEKGTGCSCCVKRGKEKKDILLKALSK